MAIRRKVKAMKAWADVGSHGGIFAFDCGEIADRYPGLLQIYTKQLTPDLVPVKISAWVDEEEPEASTKPTDVFSRPECIFNYCPNRQACKESCIHAL